MKKTIALLFLLLIGVFSFAQELSMERVNLPENYQLPIISHSNKAPIPDNMAYATDAVSEQFVYFPYNIGTPVTDISSYGGADLYAGDLGPGKVYYTIDYSNSSLYTADINTGTLQLIGLCSGLNAGHSVTGMSYHSSTNTMYVSSSTGSESALYTCDLGTAALTAIGEITNAPIIISIAINEAGELYGLEIVNDNIIRINTSSGAGTIIGYAGIDANYAQGADFDDANHVMYLSSYSTVPEYRTVDLTTGMTTLVASFDLSREICGLAIDTTPAPPSSIPLSNYAVLIAFVLIISVVVIKSVKF